MTDFYVIGDATDPSFCRIADTSAIATEMVSWLNNDPDHTGGIFSYVTETVTDTQLIILYRHAAQADLANFHHDIAQFGGYIP